MIQIKTTVAKDFLGRSFATHNGCGGTIHWEKLGSLRVWREQKGRKVYSARCEKCRVDGFVDGGKAE